MQKAGAWEGAWLVAAALRPRHKAGGLFINIEPWEEGNSVHDESHAL